MSKILMREVYEAVLWARSQQICDAESSGKEAIRYTFKDFRTDCGRDDLIVTDRTLKQKWDCAVADEVLLPYGREYKSAHLMIPQLRARAEGCMSVSMPVFDAGE